MYQKNCGFEFKKTSIIYFIFYFLLFKKVTFIFLHFFSFLLPFLQGLQIFLIGYCINDYNNLGRLALVDHQEVVWFNTKTKNQKEQGLASSVDGPLLLIFGYLKKLWLFLQHMVFNYHDEILYFWYLFFAFSY